MTRWPLVSGSLRQRAWLGSHVPLLSGLELAASFRGRMSVTEMLDRVMASACPAVWPEEGSFAMAVMLRRHGFADVSSPPSPRWVSGEALACHQNNSFLLLTVGGAA